MSHLPADTHRRLSATEPVGSPALSEGLGPNAQAWTCFHCGEVCADADAARLHFGASEHQQPGCQIDLAEYRRMEEVNRRHCEEDTELHRALHRMECEHRQALLREEEAGYAKGLRDAVEALRQAAIKHGGVRKAEAFAWARSVILAA